MGDILKVGNEFRQDEIYETYQGRVIRVKQQAGENADNKRLYIDVEPGIGGRPFLNVPYYGGGIDHVTNFPHGLFIPPRVEQTVLIMFLRGSSQNPVACCPVPYPNWTINEADLSKYNNIMTSLDDIALFHFSGARIYLRANGTIELTKKIGSTEYKLSFIFSDTKKTFTITDLSTDNKIIFDEDGIQIKGKNGVSGILKDAARKDDEVKSTSVEDAAFWGWAVKYNAFNVTWAAALGVLSAAGGLPVNVVTYCGTMATALTALGTMPTSLTGKITKASNEVKISGASA